MKETPVSKFHDFNLDEGALWLLCESANAIAMKAIAEVDQKRRELKQLTDKAESAIGLEKLCLVNEAKHLLLGIQRLMKQVGHYEYGRS
jgi:hypothetical protein